MCLTLPVQQSVCHVCRSVDKFAVTVKPALNSSSQTVLFALARILKTPPETLKAVAKVAGVHPRGSGDKTSFIVCGGEWLLDCLVTRDVCVAAGCVWRAMHLRDVPRLAHIYHASFL